MVKPNGERLDKVEAEQGEMKAVLNAHGVQLAKISANFAEISANVAALTAALKTSALEGEASATRGRRASPDVGGGVERTPEMREEAGLEEKGVGAGKGDATAGWVAPAWRAEGSRAETAHGWQQVTQGDGGPRDDWASEEETRGEGPGRLGFAGGGRFGWQEEGDAMGSVVAPAWRADDWAHAETARGGRRFAIGDSGLRAGRDRREQKKLAAKNETEVQDEIRKKEGTEEAREEAAAQKKKEQAADLYDTIDMRVDRHWSEKKLEKMTERDCRIFREDFNISYKGSRIPRPMRSWAESKLGTELLKAVERAGYKTPSPSQMAAILLGLQQRDVIGIAETGSELAQQIKDETVKFAHDLGIKVAMPSSNMKPENEDEELDDKKIYRTTYMFSATIPPAVERLARKYLRNPVVVNIGTATKATDLITQHIMMMKESDKRDRLRRLLDELGDKTAIVFVNTKKVADNVAKNLDKEGYRVTTLHYGKSLFSRKKILRICVFEI